MRRTLIPLVVATVAVVLLAIYTNRRTAELQASLEGEPLLPQIVAAEDRIAAVRLARGDQAVRLELLDGGWVSTDLSGYPADLERVAQLVRGLAELRKVEAKTARPDRHARLGLSDPASPESTAVLVELLDADDVVLAAVLLGQRYFELPGEHLFARLPDEDQTWLASGSVRAQTTPMSWIDPVAIALGSDAVESVARIEQGAETFRISRPDGQSFQWEATPVPDGQQVSTGGLPGRIGRLLANLRFDRVRPRTEVALPDAPAHRWSARTFDGLEVRVRAYEASEVEPSADGEDDTESEARLWVALDLALPEPSPEDPAALERARAQLEAHRGVTADWLYRVDTFTSGALEARAGQIFEALPEEEGPADEDPEGEPPIGPPASGASDGAPTADDGG